MNQDAFTLKKKKNTKELHLFIGKMTSDNAGCTSVLLSICQKMDRAESESNIFSCETEVIARKKCAEIGKEVCGICVSSLYANYEK